MSDFQTLVAQEVKRQVASLLTADSTVKKVLNYLKSSGGGHSLGDTWISIDGSIPAGGVPFCGQLVTRAMYADLFAWAQEQGKVKTESEWQAHASANGGNCPYYSDGDGSTNFRMPAVVAYLKGATSASNAGQYTKQGLPNVTGVLGRLTGEHNTDPGQFEGAFAVNSALNLNHGGVDGATNARNVDFDASRCSSIYGNSLNVTPETYTVLTGVYAIGEIGNVGGADVSDILSAVAAIETEVNAKLDSSTAHVVETWSSGSCWYRVWSDGLIEQGGYESAAASQQVTLSFPVEFTSSEGVTVLLSPKTTSFDIASINAVKSVSTSSMVVFNGSKVNLGFYWQATGYEMATANETVLKVLNHMNEKIESLGGVVDSWSDGDRNWSEGAAWHASGY